MPEVERAIRHQLRTRLTAVGFGRVGAAVWIAPARALDAGRRVISELDIAMNCSVFVGRYAGERDLREIVREGWDLRDLETRYHEFIANVSAGVAVLSASTTVEPSAAFAHYLSTVDRWRQLPYEDPGLPSALIGPSWPAAHAGALFEETVNTFGPVALDYAASRWPTT